MKKIFFFAAALITAVSVNAEVVTKTAAEVCNYLDIQAEAATLTAVVPTSTTCVTAANGSEFWGYAKADGTEASVTWNTKESYNTNIIMPELAGTLDTLVAGTMYRAGSGCYIKLGAFTTTAAGKVQVYFQPNGDSERGINISYANANLTADKLGSGVKIDDIRPGYVAELTIPAGYYNAGDVVVTVLTNTCNIFGVNIEGLPTSGIASTLTDSQVRFNGTEVVNPQGLEISVYNVLGKMIATSNTNIDMTSCANGVYLVRAAGVKGAMKIQK